MIPHNVAAKVFEHSFGLFHRTPSLFDTRSRFQSLCVYQICKAWSSHKASSYPTIYKTLDHNKAEIRVIRLEPGNQDDAISCRLEAHSLNHRPRYDTLSYTWGNPKPTKSIRVNDNVIYVAENLFVALRSVRHKRRVVKVWADALCIDQSNNHEKSFQVAMMDRIYSQCRQTWISLGYPNEIWANGDWRPSAKLEGWMEFVKYMIRGTWRLFWYHLVLRRSRLSRLSVNHVSDAVRLVRMLTRKKQLSNGNEADKRIAHSMLSWLITHPYWTRVWIAQEVCLSKLDPICMFGKWRISLLHLDTVLSDWQGDWYDIDRTADTTGALTHDLVNAVHRTTEICMLRDEFRQTRVIAEPRWLGLTRCLQLASHRNASLEHDYVYGLRSLLSPETRNNIRLDYNLSVRSLYAAVTRSVLQHEGSLEILCAAVGTDTGIRKGLPSWVLDFSAPLLTPLSRVKNSSFKLVDQKTGEDEVLSIFGMPLNDSVVAVHGVLSKPWADTQKLRTGSDVLQGAVFAKNQLYQCLEFAYAVGCKPNPGDHLHIMMTPIYVHDVSRDFEHHQRTAFREKLSIILDEHMAAERNLLGEGPLQYAFPILSSFAKDWVGLPGRNDTFFCTKTGGIGKSSGEVQVGDELWELSTCKTPFLLRPKDKDASGNTSFSGARQYRLVGPCVCSGSTQDLLRSKKSGIQQIRLF